MEKEGKGAEKFGKDVRNGGIIAAVLGLVLSEALIGLGILTAVGGEIFSRAAHNAKKK